MSRKTVSTTVDPMSVVPDLATEVVESLPKGEKITPVMRLGGDFVGEVARKATKEVEENNKNAARRTMELAKKVSALDIPDSMKHYILIQNLDDKEIHRMAEEWKAGHVVRHGAATWGDPDLSKADERK